MNFFVSTGAQVIVLRHLRQFPQPRSQDSLLPVPTKRERDG